jgi:ABC-2 type transport system ATP-binding protein
VTRLAVRCRGLVKRYGSVVAVDGLDLEVVRGECFGLLGPNGAGKTTTVEVLEGLLTADAGDVEVLGEHWTPTGAATLRDRLGVQLQETQFPEKLTVLETVTLFRSFHARGGAPEEALRLVELTEKRKAYIRHLSGGQRQRLSLACALVGSPELLFLDEPTTGLDPQSRRQIWEIVGRFRAEGGTVLLTTHYMEEAQRLCDRVAIIDRGRVIALGTPGELVSGLGAEHVVELEGAGPVELARLEGLPGVRTVTAEERTVRLTVDAVHASLPAVLGELERQRVDLVRLATHHATLEDVFVSLTGRQLRDA